MIDRRVLKRMLLLAAALGLLGAGSLGFLVAALDAGRLREPLLRYIDAHAGRHFEVRGAFHPHLLSMHPSFVADQVEIGNPYWMPPGATAHAAHMELVFHLPWFGRPLSIDRLVLDSATLHLTRDAGGRANWQWRDPALAPRGSMPIIHSLSLAHARVFLDDERRHLKFAGTLTAEDAADASFHLTGEGQLNEHPVSFEVEGDALSAARSDRPYHFTYREESSGSELKGGGELPKPLDFSILDASFEAQGADLKDLYYLTGVSLVNTGRYRLTGKMSRRDVHTAFTDLRATTGESDVEGEVAVDSSADRPRIEATLRSQFLRLADMGLRAAGRAPPDPGPKRLLSDAALTPKAVRHGDAVVDFRARKLRIGRFDLTAAAAHLDLMHGVAVVAPMTADLLQGKLDGRVRFDATSDAPRADFDLKLTNAELSQWPRKDDKPASIEGRLQARAKGNGRGSSIHQVAGTSNGTLTLVVPHGAMRSSLAELTGLDLKGVGLMMSKSDEASNVRCAAASFEAHEGTLTAATLVIDTTPVLIAGSGTIQLVDESLDLSLRGRPKSPHLLHLRAPVLVKGTLADPQFAVEAGHSAGQAAVAVALGVLLTPLASVLAFVDPGLAKDADCAGLISNAKSVESQRTR